MHKADDYRDRARQFRNSAMMAHATELRAYYAGLADIWDRLADEWLTLEVLPGPDLGGGALHHFAG